jgi:tricorn protease
VYDIAGGETKLLDIDLPSDFDQMRERWIKEPVDWLTSARLSDDGGKLVLTARGQVFVTPVDGGRMVEVTRRNGVRYRQARLLPDGETVLTLSDEGGEVEWWSFQADGFDEGRQVSTDGTILRFDGRVSPDGKMVASWNHDQEIWLHDLATGEGTRVDFSPQWGFDNPHWSPDSRWIAWSKPAGNALMQVFLYEVTTGKKIALTTDRYDSYSTAFTPDGKAVYLLSDRNIRSIVFSPWGSKQQEPFFDKQTRLYRVPLLEEDRSPFQATDELVEPEADDDEKDGRVLADSAGRKGKKEESRKGRKGKKGTPADDDDGDEEEDVQVEVNEDGLVARIQDVPVPPGNYGSLAVNGERLFWLSSQAGGNSRELMAMEIGNDDPEPVTLATGVRSYQLSRDGKKLLIRKGDAFHVIDASAGKDADLSEGTVDLSGWMFPIDPREEWLQMFVESWRLERDYFYDKGMHGVDWNGMLHKYLPLIDRVRSRDDLADLQGQMAGELSTLHTFVGAGDTREGDDNIRPASLGARLVRDVTAGGYRVEHIYRTDPDIPGELSPLLKPGVQVRDGDVITRVNGVAVLSAPSIASLLRNQAGKQVRLTIGDREVMVEPVALGRERDMQYDEWEYTRRLVVEKKGVGEIGYVHLRAMGAGNMAEWYREFYPVIDRKGLVIDARHNRGGNIESWILSRLIRQVWMYWQPRVGGGSSWENMQRTFRGHLVLLVDAQTASDGEAFAAGFRRLGLGKVIGTRTWGGEVWLSSSNTLVDNGIMTAAEFGVYGPEGEWLIEGHGFEPDIVVDNLPHDTFNGGDAQLDAAIRHLEKLIADDPREVPEAPEYPDKSFEN